MEQGEAFKKDENLEDKTEDLLQEVLSSVETDHNLEVSALEEAIKTDFNLPIERDSEIDLTPEHGEMIVIDHDHLEISPDVSGVAVRTGR